VRIARLCRARTPTRSSRVALALSLGFSSTSLGLVYNNSNFIVNSVSSTSVANTVTASITSETAPGECYWVGGLTGLPTSGPHPTQYRKQFGRVPRAESTTQALTPGATTNVTFTTTGTVAQAPTATVLGANMVIKSLTIADANGMNLLADGNTLYIDPTAGTAGITINSGTGATTIGAKRERDHKPDLDE